MRGSAWRATARSAAASRPPRTAEELSGPRRVDAVTLHRLGGHDRPQTAALVTAVLADHPYPEQGYRSCVGILRLAKRYDAARLEAAFALLPPPGGGPRRAAAAALLRPALHTPPPGGGGGGGRRGAARTRGRR